jgi:hypothetical protein
MRNRSDPATGLDEKESARGRPKWSVGRALDEGFEMSALLPLCYRGPSELRDGAEDATDMPSYKSLLIAGALLLTPEAAFAQQEVKAYPECSREPTEGDVNAAKGAFQAGQGSFNEADYARAIVYWEDAYRRDCTADALLLNLSRAYELSGQRQQAVVALETYLARKPDTRERAQITRRIDVLKTQMQSEQATAPPPGGETTTPPPGGELTTAPPPGGDPGALPPPDAAGKKPVTPLIVAGAGGLLTIVGGILYFNAAGEVSDFEDQCGADRKGCDPAVVDDANAARDKQNLWGVVTVVGLVAAAGGIIWYVASPPKAAPTARLEKTPRLSPAVGPGFAGLSVAGAF